MQISLQGPFEIPLLIYLRGVHYLHIMNRLLSFAFYNHKNGILLDLEWTLPMYDLLRLLAGFCGCYDISEWLLGCFW